MRAAKTWSSLRIHAGSSEPSLLDNAISTKSHVLTQIYYLPWGNKLCLDEVRLLSVVVENHKPVHLNLNYMIYVLKLCILITRLSVRSA